MICTQQSLLRKIASLNGKATVFFICFVFSYWEKERILGPVILSVYLGILKVSFAFLHNGGDGVFLLALLCTLREIKITDL